MLGIIWESLLNIVYYKKNELGEPRNYFNPESLGEVNNHIQTPYPRFVFNLIKKIHLII